MKKTLCFLIVVFIMFSFTGSVIYASDSLSASSFNGFLAWHLLSYHLVLLGLVGIVVLVLIIVTFLLLTLTKKHEDLKHTTNDYKNMVNVRASFNDALDDLVYLKDSKFRYIFVNDSLENFYGRKKDLIIGLDDYALSDEDFANSVRQTDALVLSTNERQIYKLTVSDRVYNVTKFPVDVGEGNIGIGAYIRDITKEHFLNLESEKILSRQKILIETIARTTAKKTPQFEMVLKGCLALTDSDSGFIVSLTDESDTYQLISQLGCEADSHYETILTDIINDSVFKELLFEAHQTIYENRASLTYDTLTLSRFLLAPMVVKGSLKGFVFIANKNSPYNQKDINHLELLLSGAYSAFENQRILDLLALEHARYYQTLYAIGDAVITIDMNKKVSLLNPTALEMVGLTKANAIGRPYHEVIQLQMNNSSDRNPIDVVFKTKKIYKMEDTMILKSADNSHYVIEDSVAPILDKDNTMIGVVLVFKDVTDRIKQEAEIKYISYHDSLTNLYNRRYMENIIKTMPVKTMQKSGFLMADVNGLKMLNDVFGHAIGDALLKAAAQTLKELCKGYVVSRWGGDEFLVLVTNTSKEALKLLGETIQDKFGENDTAGFKNSISVGSSMRSKTHQDATDTIIAAERSMYKNKVIIKSNLTQLSPEKIMSTFHNKNPYEQTHSIKMQSTANGFGKFLGLEQVSFQRLSQAAYYSNIGKVYLSHELLTKTTPLTKKEWDLVRQHPVVGYRILHAADDTLEIADIVLAHHEHYDGSGYPKKLKGLDIPYLSRILRILDGYIAMCNPKPHNVKKPLDDIMTTLIADKGKMYDADLLEQFLRYLKMKS